MKVLLYSCLLLACLFVAFSNGAAFTQGNIVVAQYAPTANFREAKQINIKEYSPSGTFVQTVSLPTSTGTYSYRCTTTGESVEGKLAISPDRTEVGIACYNAAVGAFNPSSGIPPERVTTFFDSNGAISNQIGWGGEFPTFPLSAVKVGNRVYASGDTSIMSSLADSSNRFKVNYLQTSYARSLKIFGGQLFIHINSVVLTVGTGLPTTGVSVTGIITASGDTMRDFVGFDLSESVKGYDTIFTVDSTTKTLQKFSFSGTTWTAAGSATLATAPTAITGQVDSNGDPILYITSTTRIEKYNGLTFVSTIVSDGEFHGASMAPHGLCADNSLTTSIGESDVDCGGRVCERCANGKTCSSNLDCLENVCLNGLCVTACADGVKNFGETDVDCGGNNCRNSYKCSNGKVCAANTDCASSVCSNNVCAAPTCSDGVKNQGEADVDCGGPCSTCADGKKCTVNNDCLSLSCSSNICAATGCSNGAHDGTETDVDCGGSCHKCATGKACSVKSDCVIDNCVDNVCAVPTCSDNTLNQDETDVDCGGQTCNQCAVGDSCSVNSDCSSLHCVGSVCVAATCSDSIKNQDETDVDCGGACNRCADNKICSTGNDCTSFRCVNNLCAVATCNDATKNQDETDVDCGGNTCATRCANTKACTENNDCASVRCSNNVCVASSCTDSIKNQGETDIDCGGPNCAQCGTNAVCAVNNDCLSLRCVNLKCAAPTCSDTVENQDETDVDCGGTTCAKCTTSKACKTGSDCVSGSCINNLCRAPSCFDGLKNQDEADVDCGGSCAKKCSAGNQCTANTDCKSNSCAGSLCQATCFDVEKNQDETDVDCGGSCTQCSIGKSCSVGADCTSAVCTGNICTQSCNDLVKNNGETDIDCGGPICASCSDGKICAKNSDCASNFCDGNVCATPSVPVPPFQCACSEPAPFCDIAAEACVGLRVTPVLQCIEFDSEADSYVASMSYYNSGDELSLSSDINYLNIGAGAPPSQFLPGRPYYYPQNAFTFTITPANSQSVTWYLDGFELTFDIADQQLRCPADVSFTITSSATVQQLISISDTIIDNLALVMAIGTERINVTFSAVSNKRQATSRIIVVVLPGDGPSAALAVTDFLENNVQSFAELVPEAGVQDASASALSSQQTVESPMTAAPVSAPAIVSVSAASIVSASLTIVACIALAFNS